MSTLDAIRTAGEHDIEDVLRQLDDKHKAMLRAAIAQYGRVQYIPESVWLEIERNMEDGTAAAILMLLVLADDWTTTKLTDAGAARRALTPEQLDAYSRTADRRARAIAVGSTATLRSRLTRKIEDAALTGPGDLGQTTDGGIDGAMQDVFTQDRRDTIAVDMTTTAISDGQRGAAQRMGGGRTNEGFPYTIELFWKTERDDRVCPRCAPLDGQPEEVWSRIFPEGPGPAVHPRCRCELDITISGTQLSEARRESLVA